MTSNTHPTPATIAEHLVEDLGPRSTFRAIWETTKLRNALRLNAALSAVCGLTGAIAPSWVAAQLGISAVTGFGVRGIGLSLTSVALVMVLTAGAPARRLLAGALGIAISDLALVAATILLVAGGRLSAGGSALAVAAGVAVGALAVHQLRARHRAVEASADGADARLDESPPFEAVLVSRTVDLPAERLWPVMIDHGLYASLAANLGGARVVTENGPGLVRECRDAGGRSWREQCLLWEPGQRFAMNVETDADDYPYPLELLQGSWGVEARGPSSSEVTMAFALRPRRSVLGRLMPVGMHLVLPIILRRILRGWTREAARR